MTFSLMATLSSTFVFCAIILISAEEDSSNDASQPLPRSDEDLLPKYVLKKNSSGPFLNLNYNCVTAELAATKEPFVIFFDYNTNGSWQDTLIFTADGYSNEEKSIVLKPDSTNSYGANDTNLYILFFGGSFSCMVVLEKAPSYQRCFLFGKISDKYSSTCPSPSMKTEDCRQEFRNCKKRARCNGKCKFLL
uniref:Putative secreted protein n=1 Tax=Amblyomma triste TaxID=251400 RepID=A0A023G317_AMBTT